MGELGSPESLPEMERPPLRKIDMYIRPDCPCCNMTKRYTVAFLASIGTLNYPVVFEKKQKNCDDDC
jgi:ACS family sodium-dependent inorganic phosphate cotransporter-like MFS transporter 6/7/8